MEDQGLDRNAKQYGSVRVPGLHLDLELLAIVTAC